jgi:hypothetical protein
MISSAVVEVGFVGADAMQPLQGWGEYHTPISYVGIALHQPLPT